MDEDEELYRLMNEEDDFYMGDRDDEADEPDNASNNRSPQNNAGCLILLPLIFALMVLAVVLVV